MPNIVLLGLSEAKMAPFVARWEIQTAGDVGLTVGFWLILGVFGESPRSCFRLHDDSALA